MVMWSKNFDHDCGQNFLITMANWSKFRPWPQQKSKFSMVKMGNLKIQQDVCGCQWPWSNSRVSWSWSVPPPWITTELQCMALYVQWRHCTVKLGLDVFTITFKYGLKNGSKLWVPTALLSSTESHLKKKPSCLFDESHLKDRLFISFLDVVQFRAFQSCAGDVFCSSCLSPELPASELEIFNPNL